MSFDTARITKATLTVTLKVVCVFMALSPKNAATSALSDYVKTWPLFGGFQMRLAGIVGTSRSVCWPPHGRGCRPAGEFSSLTSTFGVGSQAGLLPKLLNLTPP